MARSLWRLPMRRAKVLNRSDLVGTVQNLFEHFQQSANNSDFLRKSSDCSEFVGISWKMSERVCASTPTSADGDSR